MPLLSPRGVGFRSIKHLINRLYANRETERHELISVDDIDVPEWQRQIVWTSEEMGLLVYSIIRNYPIGMIILWNKPDGIRVPIDGKQRITAIRRFYEGDLALPSLPAIPRELWNKKYTLLDGDQEKGFSQLSTAEKEVFEDFELSMVQYENIDESVAMDIFVRLQGGKSLTKTEVRAALGGELCDFVTSLTSNPDIDADEDDIEEVPSRHAFFSSLSRNIRNIRKAHRNICDILLHEYLYPNQDKHWSSLESMYREKAHTITEREMSGFRASLGRFQRSAQLRIGAENILMPQLRSAYLILSVYKVWKMLTDTYDLPSGSSFQEAIVDFETNRQATPDDSPWINFTSALSNAGYAQNRIKTRHDILTTHLLNFFPDATPKQRDRRTFTDEQKVAIWERAGHQCEYVAESERCSEEFPNFREADADHIVKWDDNGPTSISNGRLLCQTHNRGRR